MARDFVLQAKQLWTLERHVASQVKFAPIKQLMTKMSAGRRCLRHELHGRKEKLRVEKPAAHALRKQTSQRKGSTRPSMVGYEKSAQSFLA